MLEVVWFVRLPFDMSLGGFFFFFFFLRFLGLASEVYSFRCSLESG